jgi:hypothetical protein
MNEIYEHLSYPRGIRPRATQKGRETIADRLFTLVENRLQQIPDIPGNTTEIDQLRLVWLPTLIHFDGSQHIFGKLN